MSVMTRLIIISGRSGSGKSSALDALEDQGFYCVDNLPIDLIPVFLDSIHHSSKMTVDIALGIDARNLPESLNDFESVYRNIVEKGIFSCSIVFLDAEDKVILQRYSSTRRRHPYANHEHSLEDAIQIEKKILATIVSLADLRIDTTNLTLHQLRSNVRERVLNRKEHGFSLQIQSFGFKYGVPNNADFVFDVRCLPNPYWNQKLRHKTGLDGEVINYFKKHEAVKKMINDISRFLLDWFPDFKSENRSYMTVAIGCTGGQHRSVYICEQLSLKIDAKKQNWQVHHRELSEK